MISTQKSKKNSEKKAEISNLITPLEQNLENETRRRPCQRKTNEQIQEEASCKDYEMETCSAEQDESLRVSEIVSNLISKNKINSKNAFQIPLIDVSEMPLFQKGDDGAWNKISSTLENSSKIYGYRVDCVSENISKLTDSISRNLDTKNEQLQEKRFGQKRQLHSYEFNSEYNSRKIEIHLDQERLIGQNLDINNKTQANYYQIRRIMDQTGVRALILTNFPILSDLSIGITSKNSSPFQKVAIDFQDQAITLKKIGQVKSQQKMSIFKKIYQLRRLFFPTQFQTLEWSQSNVNNYADQLEAEENNHFCQQRISQSKNFDALAHNHSQVRDWEVQFDKSFKNVKNSVLEAEYEKKKKQTIIIKSKVKKQKKQRKSLTKNKKQLSILEFEPSVALSREILHLPKSKKESEKQIRIKQENLYSSLLFAYQISEWSNNINFSNFQVNPHQRNNVSQNQGLLLIQEEGQTEIFVTHEPETSEVKQKVPQIRQTKQQIYQILNKLWEINPSGEKTFKFSQVHQMHKLNSRSCIEAIDFLAVLHLANQLGLYLKQTEKYDFIISQRNGVQT